VSHVEVVAVGAHVDVVEPAGFGPQELGADGEALDVVVEQRLAVRLRLVVEERGEARSRAGDRVGVGFDAARALRFDAETGRRLR
jgi:hypothetical protein